MSPNEPLPIFLTRRYFCAITNSGGLTRLDIFWPKLSQQCEQPIWRFNSIQGIGNSKILAKKEKRRKGGDEGKRTESIAHKRWKFRLTPSTVDQSTNLTMWSSHFVVCRATAPPREGKGRAGWLKTSCDLGLLFLSLVIRTNEISHSLLDDS